MFEFVLIKLIVYVCLEYVPNIVVANFNLQQTALCLHHDITLSVPAANQLQVSGIHDGMWLNSVMICNCSIATHASHPEYGLPCVGTSCTCVQGG